MRTPAIAILLALPMTALAQGNGGVAGSGMGQGQARISSRSDVRLAMESLPGTTAAQVTLLGQRVGQRMQQIRQCYDDVVDHRPGVVGTLRLRVALEALGPLL